MQGPSQTAAHTLAFSVVCSSSSLALTTSFSGCFASHPYGALSSRRITDRQTAIHARSHHQTDRPRFMLGVSLICSSPGTSQTRQQNSVMGIIFQTVTTASPCSIPNPDRHHRIALLDSLCQFQSGRSAASSCSIPCPSSRQAAPPSSFCSAISEIMASGAAEVLLLNCCTRTFLARPTGPGCGPCAGNPEHSISPTRHTQDVGTCEPSRRLSQISTPLE